MFRFPIMEPSSGIYILSYTNLQQKYWQILKVKAVKCRLSHLLYVGPLRVRSFVCLWKAGTVPYNNKNCAFCWFDKCVTKQKHHHFLRPQRLSIKFKSVVPRLIAVKYIMEQGRGFNCSALTTISKPDWSGVRVTSAPVETQFGSRSSTTF